MWGVLRRHFFWWAYLAALARGGLAGGPGQCEVLDLSKKSPSYQLPTNLTVMPSTAGWLLEATLINGQGTTVCVRLEDKQARLRLTLLMGRCEGGEVKDYAYPDGVLTPIGVWTNLMMNVTDTAVIVSASDGSSISLSTHGSPLHPEGLQVMVKRATDVEAAIGCRINCPGYRHTSPNKKETVKTWSGATEQFYFRPVNTMILEYEVACKTSLGHKMFPQVANITSDPYLPLEVWHPVNLHHQSGEVKVRLDDRPLMDKTLPSACTFIEHRIKVVGDGVFSFTCNPSSGVMETVEKESSYVTGQAVTHLSMLSTLIVTTILVVGLLIAVSYLIYKVVRLQKHLEWHETRYHNQKTGQESLATGNTDNILRNILQLRMELQNHLKRHHQEEKKLRPERKPTA